MCTVCKVSFKHYWNTMHQIWSIILMRAIYSLILLESSKSNVVGLDWSMVYTVYGHHLTSILHFRYDDYILFLLKEPS